MDVQSCFVNSLDVNHSHARRLWYWRVRKSVASQASNRALLILSMSIILMVRRLWYWSVRNSVASETSNRAFVNSLDVRHCHRT